MKKIKFLTTICLSLMISASFAQIKIDSYSNIGIGTSTPSSTDKVTIEGSSIIFRGLLSGSYFGGMKFTMNGAVDLSPNGYFNGSSLGWQQSWSNVCGGQAYFDNIDAGYISTRSIYVWSDKRLKNNIKVMPFDRSLFSKLDPKSFDFSDSLLVSKKNKKDRRKATTTSQYGFIAQELQDIYPQLVEKDDSTGFLKIKPLELLPILVKALHDQQAQIDALTELVTKSNSGAQKVSADPTNKASETDVLTYPVLDQNIPNPFNTATTIGLYLPSTIGTAAIYVYDMNGVQLKNYSISERGKSTVTIQGSEFKAGMYLYALIADGKVIDTKRMILTK
jgi:hypothetical protein